MRALIPRPARPAPDANCPACPARPAPGWAAVGAVAGGGLRCAARPAGPFRSAPGKFARRPSLGAASPPPGPRCRSAGSPGSVAARAWVGRPCPAPSPPPVLPAPPPAGPPGGQRRAWRGVLFGLAPPPLLRPSGPCPRSSPPGAFALAGEKNAPPRAAGERVAPLRRRCPLRRGRGKRIPPAAAGGRLIPTSYHIFPLEGI